MSYLCLIASFEGNLKTALKKLKSDFTNAKKKKKKKKLQILVILTTKNNKYIYMAKNKLNLYRKKTNKQTN